MFIKEYMLSAYEAAGLVTALFIICILLDEIGCVLFSVLAKPVSCLGTGRTTVFTIEVGVRLGKVPGLASMLGVGVSLGAASGCIGVLTKFRIELTIEFTKPVFDIF
jgi:hypothetical protein